MNEREPLIQNSSETKHKWGDPHAFDPEWTGPVEKRKCKDVLFTIIFFLIFAGMIYIAVFAFSHGDPLRYVIKKSSYATLKSKSNLNLLQITAPKGLLGKYLRS